MAHGMRKVSIVIAFIVATSAGFWTSAASANERPKNIRLKVGETVRVADVDVTVDAETKTPLVSKVCVRENTSGDCKEYDYTYSVQGVSCTEECLDFDGFDRCRLRNRCIYDQGSGCFKRSVCTKVAAFAKCDDWQQEIACD